jgi:hypothetical protein
VGSTLRSALVTTVVPHRDAWHGVLGGGSNHNARMRHQLTSRGVLRLNTEDAFCFSYYDPDGGELWFLTLSEMMEVVAGQLKSIDARRPEI